MATIPNEKIDEVYNYTYSQRGLSNEVSAQTVENLKKLFHIFSEEEQYLHTAKQAHIALGLAISAAAIRCECYSYGRFQQRSS